MLIITPTDVVLWSGALVVVAGAVAAIVFFLKLGWNLIRSFSNWY